MFTTPTGSSDSTSGSFGQTIGNIAGAVPLIGGAIQAVTSIGQGRKNRRAMRQANQANIDNTWAMFNATNAYNNPLAQRQRLENAGLSPAMMYGHGTVANTANQANIPDVKAVEYPNVGEGVGSTIAQYADLRMKNASLAMMDAQKQMMNKQSQVMDADIAMKNVSTAKTAMDTSKTSLDMAKTRALWDYTLQGAQANVRNTQLSNIEKAISNSSLSERNQMAIRQIASNLQVAQSTMTKQGFESEILKQQAEMARLGINPSDPAVMRILSQAIGGDNIENAFNSTKDFFSRAYNHFKSSLKR